MSNPIIRYFGKIGFLILLSSLPCNAQSDIDSFALELVRHADSLRRNHGDRNRAIEVLNKFFDEENFDSASIDAQANIYHKIGVNYFGLLDYNSAISYFDKTIIARSQNKRSNQEALANSLYLRGRSKLRLELNRQAIVDFEKAIDIFEPIAFSRNVETDQRKLAQYYSFIATSYSGVDDFGAALKFNNAAAAKYEVAYGNDHFRTAGFYSSFALFLRRIGNEKEAMDYYEKELNIYNKLGTKQFESLIINANLNLANGFVIKRDYKTAIEKYTKILKDVGSRNESNLQIDIDNVRRTCFENIGLCQLNLRNYVEARRNYEFSLKLKSNSLDSPIYSAKAYEGLADVDAAESNFPSALNNYQKAISLLCLDFEYKDNFALPNLKTLVINDKITLKRILALKAKTLTDYYTQSKKTDHLQAAFQTYNSLDQLIAIIRQSYQSDVSRYDLIGGTVTIYEKAVQTALDLYELKKDKSYLQAAFDFSSKNKAIVLLEGKQNEEAKFAGIPTELLEQERTLKKELFDLEQAIFQVSRDEGENKNKVDSLGQLRFTQSREYEKLIANFEANFPDYHQLKYASAAYLDAESLIAKLPESGAMIEYFVGNAQLIIFTLSKKGLTYERVTKPDNFEKLCQDFRNFSDGTNRLNLSDYSKLSNELYSLLLEKTLNKLSSENIDRLFIIPDDRLYELSFDALFYETPASTILSADWGAKDLPYLIKKYAISFAYSNQLLFDEQLNKEGGKKLFAGFGLDYREAGWEGPIESGTRALGSNWRGKIRPLPYAVEEVDEIGAVLRGDTWLNQEATKENFVKNAGQYKILHLAMHGVVEKDFPLSSALIFDKQIDSSDYLLTAGDLYSQQLNAEMVVLSACDTGSGQLQKGEGAMTLARAFKYSGCPSLVASLWSASDEPTKDLMVSFYSHLKSGLPKDQALQQAKLEYLQKDLSPNESKPFNWSHIAIIGDASALDLRTSNFYYWLIGLGLILLMAFFIRRFR